jgi:hypothetical protein
MKVTTWNVNGIRARAPTVLEWVRREQPDVLCLQEIKASPEAVPALVCDLPATGATGTATKATPASVCTCARRRSRTARFRPSALRRGDPHRHRADRDWVIASVYVPNGNRDYPTKVRFLDALDAFVADAHASGRQLLVCGTSTWPRSRATSIPSCASRRRPGRRRKSRPCSRAPWTAGSSTSCAASIPTTTASSRGGRPGGRCARRTSVAPRLHPGQPASGRDRSQHRGRAHVRHQRSRAGHGGLRRPGARPRSGREERPSPARRASSPCSGRGL